MTVAFGADDTGPLTDALLAELEHRGITAVLFGALLDGSTAWASIGRAVGEAVASGRAERGIVCCWTGTGVTIAANKIVGARAALCADVETARGARRWNDANVVGLSLRATAPAVGREILAAFLDEPVSADPADRREIEAIEQSDRN